MDPSKRKSDMEGNWITFWACGCCQKVTILCDPYFNRVDIDVIFLNSSSHRVKVKMLLGINNIAHSFIKWRQFFDNVLVFSICSLENETFIFGTLVYEFFIQTSVSKKLAQNSVVIHYYSLCKFEINLYYLFLENFICKCWIWTCFYNQYLYVVVSAFCYFACVVSPPKFILIKQ